MKLQKLSKLENDNNFKKKHLSGFFWIKKVAIYPPSLIIFIALFGLVYLLNYNLLISVYAIPFAVLLLLGAVWLKTVKKYLLKELFAKDNTFLVALAKVVATDEKDRLWSVFTTTPRRHDKYYPETVKKMLLEENFFESDVFLQFKEQQKEKVLVLGGEVAGGSNIYLKAFKRSDIKKYNGGWTEDECFLVLFIDKDNIALIKRKNAE